MLERTGRLSWRIPFIIQALTECPRDSSPASSASSIETEDLRRRAVFCAAVDVLYRLIVEFESFEIDDSEIWNEVFGA